MLSCGSDSYTCYICLLSCGSDAYTGYVCRHVALIPTRYICLLSCGSDAYTGYACHHVAVHHDLGGRCPDNHLLCSVSGGGGSEWEILQGLSGGGVEQHGQQQ